MNYCPFCDEDLSDYNPYTETSTDSDYEMDEPMEDYDFGHEPINRGLKRSRSQAGMDDLQKPGPRKRQRLNPENDDPMIICID